MKIETIRLKNFKVFQNVNIIEVPSFCVVVGANGSGKSTLFDVFHFLKDCLSYNVTTALRTRGGFHEVVSREHENESIDIEIQFRTEINNVDRLITYILEIAEPEKGHLVIEREILRYKRGAFGSPFHFLDYSHGRGFAITNEDDFDKKDEQLEREEQDLNSPDILAIKGVGQFQRFKAANAFRQFIENWNVSDFHIDHAWGSKDAAGFSEHLSASGDNLQLAANYLYEYQKPIFKNILKKCGNEFPVWEISSQNKLQMGAYY